MPERYMGLPQENQEGYTASSVMAHVQDMKDTKYELAS